MLIEHLPGWVVQALPVIGLLVVGYVVERHYVSRVTCFTNSLALTVYVFEISDPTQWVIFYAEFGLGWGLLGMAAYADRTSLGDWYYLPAFFLYASLPVGAVILLPTPFLPTLIVAGLLNFALGLAWDEMGGTVIYYDALPGSVSRFLDEHVADSQERRDGSIVLLLRP